MSIFSTRVTALNKRLELLTAALATIGFDPALLEQDPQALAAHVSTLGAQEDSAVTASIEKLNTDLAAEKEKTAAALATVAAVTTALTDAGLKTALSEISNLKSEIEALVTAKATAQVASSGHAPLSLPGASDADSIKTSKELFTEFNAITDPQKRAAFWAAHSARMLN